MYVLKDIQYTTHTYAHKKSKQGNKATSAAYCTPSKLKPNKKKTTQQREAIENIEKKKGKKKKG